MPEQIKKGLDVLKLQFSKTRIFCYKILANLKKTLRKKTACLPCFAQCKHFFNVLTKKEKITFLVFLFCFLFSFIFLSRNFYSKHTQVEPISGGILIEGVIGQPRFINPVLASSDVDRDLIELLFSGLIKYDENGALAYDLAEKYDISEQGKIYEITLKKDIFWHDGKPITADDIIFTINTIQNENYKSPEFANWLGITVEKTSETKVIFRLRNAYFPFLERLTLKILPQHIFEQIPIENFALAEYNLKPIGSGSFKFKSLKYNNLGKIEYITLSKNKDYFEKLPYLEEISFRFFETEQDLIKSGSRNDINSLVTSDPDSLDSLKNKGFFWHRISLPRYFAVFFNQKNSDLLKKKEIRQSLSAATNKQAILQEVINERGKVVNSPILPEVYNFEYPNNIIEFDLDKAKQLLEEQGFEQKNGKFIDPKKNFQFTFTKDLKYGHQEKEVEELQKCLSLFPDVYPEAKITGYFGESTKKAVTAFQEKYREDILDPWDFEQGTGIVAKTTREKLNEVCNPQSEDIPVLTFSLKTVNQPFLVKTAEIIKSQWQDLGINLEIKAFEFGKLSNDVIKPRDYEMILFGQALNIVPDPFAFWHSSKINDPGLNLSLYENKKADSFLKDARESVKSEDLINNLQEFQNILVEDIPAIFLYSPDFMYLISNNVKGINLKIISDPSKRFIGIENWYIQTQRVWK